MENSVTVVYLKSFLCKFGIVLETCPKIMNTGFLGLLLSKRRLGEYKDTQRHSVSSVDVKILILLRVVYVLTSSVGTMGNQRTDRRGNDV